MMRRMDGPKMTQYAFEMATTWGMRLLGVIVALVVAWMLSGWVRRAVIRSLEPRLDLMVTTFIANLARYAVLTGAVLSCLGVFGIQTTSFAAVLGAAGLAIGLAFQGTLSNFAAGIMLLVFRPFRAGDWVDIAGEVGAVKELELFTTEIVSPDNRRIILPNSEIVKNKIINITHYPHRRVEVLVGTAYDADIDETRRVLESVFADVEGTLSEPAPQVFLAELGDSSINWKVRAHANTADFWAVHQRLVAQVKRALDAANISIPFPQRDVNLRPETVKMLAGQPDA